MPYNFAAESFHTKKLCSRLSSRKVQFSVRETKKKFVSEVPFGGLGATYDVHLRLIGSVVGDFLLVIIELFSLSPTVEPLRANIEWKLPFLSLDRSLRPKISGRRGCLPPTILCVRKTTLIYLSFGIRILAELPFVLSQITRVTDR